MPICFLPPGQLLRGFDLCKLFLPDKRSQLLFFPKILNAAQPRVLAHANAQRLRGFFLYALILSACTQLKLSFFSHLAFAMHLTDPGGASFPTLFSLFIRTDAGGPFTLQHRANTDTLPGPKPMSPRHLLPTGLTSSKPDLGCHAL